MPFKSFHYRGRRAVQGRPLLGEFLHDFGRIWEDVAVLWQEVGWIGQTRAYFSRKSKDSRGDLVACPGGCLGAPGGMRGGHT